MTASVELPAASLTRQRTLERMDEQDEQKKTAASRSPQPRQDHEQPCLYCPNCSSRLISRHCELICTQCGYYMSCSDYV